MMRLRSVQEKDLSQILKLARELDSYNLPYDRAFLRNLLRVSVRSFQGKVPKEKAKYLFVIEDESSEEIFGTSLIVAKQGTRASPHIYFEKSGGTLRFGATKNGPTEIGGLILKKKYRGRKEKFGKQLSWVRFLYMALHPERFEKKILAEFLPPLKKGKESFFWEAFGGRFTGLSYHEADRLSIYTKKFVFDLFPRGAIRLKFLPKKIRSLLGKVSPEAVPACRMLRKIGFRPNGRIEPFDGGPYYEAERTKISVIQKAKKSRYSRQEEGPRRGKSLFLIERKGKVFGGVGTVEDVLKLGKGEAVIGIPWE